MIFADTCRVFSKVTVTLAVAASVYGANSALAAYDRNYVGETIEYEAVFEDTFVHVARDYNLGFVEMRAANPGVDPWVPGEGTDLILPARHLLPDAPREGVVINLPEMRLYAFVNGDDAPSTYPIGVGREGLDTPLGTTTVVRKTEGPIWRPTARMRREDPKLPEVVYQGPDNPMGTHALYLGWPQYAIHGTNKPFGIGRRSSSGCIRLYPEDIIPLFERVPVGTKVTVVNQPIKVAWIDNELYLEAHPTIEQAIEMEEKGTADSPVLNDADMKLVNEVAGPYQDRLNWPAIRMAVKERRGYPIKIARRPRISAAEEAAQKEQEAAVLQEKPAKKVSAAQKEAKAQPEQTKPKTAPKPDGEKIAQTEQDASDQDGVKMPLKRLNP